MFCCTHLELSELAALGRPCYDPSRGKPKRKTGAARKTIGKTKYSSMKRNLFGALITPKGPLGPGDLASRRRASRPRTTASPSGHLGDVGFVSTGTSCWRLDGVELLTDRGGVVSSI